MTAAAQADAYRSKARRALSAAQLLLSEGDTEGACNRAYYAMFYAAHVPLLRTSDAAVPTFRTHAGLIAAFGKHVVLGAKMDPELGRAVNQVQRLRQLADYTGDVPPLEDARSAVVKAQSFVDAIEAVFR